MVINQIGENQFWNWYLHVLTLDLWNSYLYKYQNWSKKMLFY